MIYGCERCWHSWEGPASTDFEGRLLEGAGYKCAECGHWNSIEANIKKFVGAGLMQSGIPTETGV